MIRRFVSRRVSMQSGTRPTLQHLYELVDMACRADMPPETELTLSVDGVRIGRFSLELQTRREAA